ncbi:hypothetical protein BAGQ_2315 [Bacillus velezensis]|nr:hypothetical protein BCBMB205_22130 [Bacillus velezensis]ARZ58548.1 hypothetical protein BAGQ_2315 [Bacillus velezensis]
MNAHVLVVGLYKFMRMSMTYEYQLRHFHIKKLSQKEEFLSD